MKQERRRSCGVQILGTVLTAGFAMLLQTGLVGCTTTGGGVGLTKPTSVKEYEEAVRAYDAGRFSEAIEQFKAFPSAHPTSALLEPALYYLGKSYEGAGDTVNAKATYQRLLTQYKSGTWADLTKRALADLK